MLKFIFFLVMFMNYSFWGEMSLVFCLFFILFLLFNPFYLEMSVFFLELDFIGWGLILLSSWVILLSFFSSLKIKHNKFYKWYGFILMLIFFFLLLTFMVSNLLVFYLMFESCLVPIILMILGWGYQPERAQAGMYMLFYTLFGSLPLLFSILYLNNLNGSSYMYLGEGLNVNEMAVFLLILAFLTKFPMYSVHLWLLKAHVEAPVAGSMILAGVLLKLGGYGMIRVYSMLNTGLGLVKELIVSLSLWGGVMLSLYCLRFMDMKLLIASSSVVHMSVCICSVFVMSDWSIKGCLVVMVAHGVCSSGLFCVANFMYSRSNSRSMMINKGFLNITPIISMWLFMLIVCNMAGPPSHNLVGEVMLLVSIINWNTSTIFFLSLLSFFSGAYSLYLYSLSQHGVCSKLKVGSLVSGSLLEYLIMFLHWLPLNVLLFGLSFFFCNFCYSFVTFKMIKIGNNIYNVLFFFLFASMFFVYSLSLYLVLKDKMFIVDWDILIMESTTCSFSVILDWMSMMFLGSVLMIASGVSKFSSYYMAGDYNFIRFMVLLSLFIGSMVFMIISPNMVSILLGWDGLGLTSYILIVYYQNETSCNAGMLTILSNRVGDVCILMIIGMMAWSGSWNFIFFDEVSFIVCALIVMAGMTKSAQIPFSAWLPAAMAAPTPVSALVHSSTLVTAGVYLLVRFYWLLQESMMFKVLLVVSVATMLMSGWAANFEFDVKKIIALSTLSQLGLMMMTLSMGHPELAYFHLISHAMFKSTLFMCGGVVIHLTLGSQDSRHMSNLSLSSPFLMVVFSLTNMALLGFPFLSGFYSKDAILEALFSGLYNTILMASVILATAMTFCYSMRVLFLSMSYVMGFNSVIELKDCSILLILSFIFLFIFSVVVGYFFSWGFSWNLELVVLEVLAKYYVFLVMVSASVYMLGRLLSLNFNTKNKMSLIFLSIVKMWNMFFLSSVVSSKYVLLGGKGLSYMDKGWMEEFGGQGGYSMIIKFSFILQMTQFSPGVKRYFFVFLLVMILMAVMT